MLGLFIVALAFFLAKRRRNAPVEDDNEINDRILEDIMNPQGPANVGITF